ncbi:hypothetical protein GCM10027396_12120 [Insolitispirillum peregrinum]
MDQLITGGFFHQVEDGGRLIGQPMGGIGSQSDGQGSVDACDKKPETGELLYKAMRNHGGASFQSESIMRKLAFAFRAML